MRPDDNIFSFATPHRRLTMSSFDAAARKLAAAPTPYPLEDLPTDRNDSAWDAIMKEYKLSLPEMVALKNYSAPMKRELDVEEILDRYERKRRRIEGRRPRRVLSYVSKSHAFSHVEAGRRIRRGAGFFFPLLTLPEASFNCTAFAEDGPEQKLDENKFHHPYFMEQMKLLVEAALSANIPIKQQVYWSNSGKSSLRSSPGTSASYMRNTCFKSIAGSSSKKFQGAMVNPVLTTFVMGMFSAMGK